MRPTPPSQFIRTINTTVLSGVWQMPTGVLVRAPYFSVILHERGWAVTLGLN